VGSIQNELNDFI